MKDRIIRSDGTELSFDQAVWCKGQIGGLTHDWVYHRADHEYKCRLCGVLYKKSELKELTD